MASPLILAPEGPRLSKDEAAFFREADPWGFIVFTRNLETPEQIRALTEEMRDAVGRDACVLIDQEGGRVQRLRPPLAREWRPPLEDADRLGLKAAQGMYLRYRIIAAELLALGIDANCAPTLDVATEETHPFLRNRCLGRTPERVSALGLAAAGGLLEGGVLPVIKHMPGHGRGQSDSHFEVPRTHAPRADLDAVDFVPFKAMNEMPLGMTGHVIFDAIDPARPATQSEIVLDIIRDDIAFDGLLMTDDISMNALNGDVASRAVTSWAAGCDIVLHCNGNLAEMQMLCAHAPGMTPQARRRASTALAARITPAPADISEFAAQYAALSA